MPTKRPVVTVREHFDKDGEEVEMLSFLVNDRSGFGVAHWCELNGTWKGTFLGYPVQGGDSAIQREAQGHADWIADLLTT